MKGKLTVMLLLLVFAVSQGSYATPVINIGNESIIIKVTEADPNFTVYDIPGKFTIPPVKINNVLYIQADKFLTALGFVTKYERKSKTFTAAMDGESLKFVVGRTNAVRNDKPFLFTNPLKEEKSVIMLPFEEFVKKFKFTVEYDAKTKTYTASKGVDHKLGNIFLYDTAAKEQIVGSIAKTGLVTKRFADIKINEVYPYKGKIVVYAYNKLSKYNSLSLFQNEKFTELLKNFDLVSSYDFGGNRVFYGYNNEEKRYQLFRYDGTALKLVEGDCYSPTQTILGDNIIVGTFNKDRRYDIKAINANWTVKTLSNGIVPAADTKHPGLTLLDSLVSGDWAYLKAVVQGDSGVVYFLAYNGLEVKWVKVETNERNLDFEHVRVCANSLYLAFDQNKDSKRELLKVNTSTATATLDPALDKLYEISAIESYLDKLYLAIMISKNAKTGQKEVKGSFSYEPSTTEVKQLEYMQAGTDVKKYAVFETSQVNNSRMYLLGGKNSDTKDLYINYGNTWAYPVFGITQITSVVNTPQGTFLNVKDIDSMTKRSRNAVLLLTSSLKVENVALDYSMKNYFVDGLTFIYSGTNTAPNTIASGQRIKESISSYSGSSRELLPGFSAKYWEPIQGSVYVSGSEDGGSRSYAVTGKDAKELKSGLVITKAAATGNPRKLLMTGSYRDVGGIYPQVLQVLFVYDLDKKTYSLIGAGVTIKNIILY